MYIWPSLNAVNMKQLIWVIDQVWGQDGWVLAKFFYCMFMEWDEIKVHKLAKKEWGQYPAILTEQAYMAFQEIFLAGQGG